MIPAMIGSNNEHAPRTNSEMATPSDPSSFTLEQIHRMNMVQYQICIGWVMKFRQHIQKFEEISLEALGHWVHPMP
jgi:hypothetical protein